MKQTNLWRQGLNSIIDYLQEKATALKYKEIGKGMGHVSLFSNSTQPLLKEGDTLDTPSTAPPYFMTRY